MVSISSAVNGPSTRRGRVILVWKGIRRFLLLFSLVAVAFFFQNLEAAGFFGGDIVPG
jgi:hypothetical protein